MTSQRQNWHFQAVKLCDSQKPQRYETKQAVNPPFSINSQLLNLFIRPTWTFYELAVFYLEFKSI